MSLNQRHLKREGNLFEKIIDLDNIRLASKKAMRGKSSQEGVKKFLLNEEENILEIQRILKEKTFTTSEYKKFEVFDGKRREISQLPFFPDRVVHHSLLNVLEPIFVKTYTADSYSCIKKRGIHKASFKLRNSLRDKNGAKYCLKFDIEKFYPNVSGEILKKLLRRKFKDKDVLWLLDDIIDSSDGLPIGSYTSQYLSNYFLTYFDHCVKEVLRVKYYMRYCDDGVILAESKEQLWEWFYKIKEYLEKELNLNIKGNYRVFPVDNIGIDWCGYVHFREYTLIRKSIKKNYIKSRNKKNWNGWLVYCNSRNLRQKYENN